MITKRELLKQLEHTECAVSEKFIELLDNFNEYELCDHRNFAGHITVSGMIVNITTRSILLLRDKILDKWILPEDHLNVEDESPISAVLRTIEQEIGLVEKNMIPMNVYWKTQYCVDIHSSEMLENCDQYEPRHDHHDFRFVFGYKGDKRIDIYNNRTVAYKWVSMDDPLMQKILGDIPIDKIVLDSLEKYEQARKESINEKYRDDYHVTCIAWYQFKLALCYSKRGEIEAAEQMYRTSIESFEHTYDDTYETPPGILSPIWNLALIYEKSNRCDLARQTFEQGLMYAEMYAGWEDGFLGEVSLFKRALDEVPIQE